MKRTGIVVLAVVLVLVIGAELALFLQMKGCVAERVAANGGGNILAGTAPDQAASGGTGSGEDAYEAAPWVAAATDVPAPAPAPVTVTDAPVPTIVPATATPGPSPEPAPETPAPTAAPTPTAVPASTGSCRSNTGTALDLYVDWSAVDLGNGATRVYVTGKASSYSLDVMSTAATVTLGGQSVVCPVESILIQEDVLTVSDLFSTSFDIPAGSVESLTVDWAFNGSYSGVDLPHLTAAGTVNG